jgi:hypothetical protein
VSCDELLPMASIGLPRFARTVVLIDQLALICKWYSHQGRIDEMVVAKELTPEIASVVEAKPDEHWPPSFRPE